MNLAKLPFTVLCIACLLVGACTAKKDMRLLEGIWRVDSVYTFYNGYGMTMNASDEQPLLRYWPKGRLSMIRGNEERFFTYELLSGDSLAHHNLKGNTIGKFLILDVTDSRLVLQKDKNPLFGGNNQLRYEIRYFSRVDSLTLPHQ